MIKRFSDLAANERTYLAWVRTAIALMAFGFLIEKFELFLRVISSEESTAMKHSLHASTVIESTGIMMMCVSVVIMVGSTIRYLIQRKDIISEREMRTSTEAIGMGLAFFMVLICLFLTGYIWVRLFYG